MFWGYTDHETDQDPGGRNETDPGPQHFTKDPLNITVKRSRLELRKNFYSNRVTEKWNSLPAELKNAKSISQFKAGYDALSAQ